LRDLILSFIPLFLSPSLIPLSMGSGMREGMKDHPFHLDHVERREKEKRKGGGKKVF